ncbi:MAG: DUF935 domain-containing protein [Candidatus Cloacimonetes bacterium]|nr:DUF935 domain-containing protein [Candidatus Cloacimonadota bacterium]
MNKELKLYHKHDEYYNMIELSPSAVRMSIANTRQFKQKLNLYYTILRDEHFLSKKHDRESIFAKAEWSIEPCENKKVNDFVYEHLWRVLTVNKLQSLHEALFCGFSIAEILWEGNIPAEVKMLPQQAFNFQEGKLFIYDEENDKYYDIPANKTIQVFAPIRINNLPVGLSEILAPTVALKYASLFKNWAHFNEFVAMPMLMGFYQNESQKTGLIKGLNNLGKSSIGVMPDGTRIEFIDPKNVSPETFVNAIEKCENAISKLIVGQTLTTQSAGTGSYAQTKIHGDVRQDFFENSINLVCEAINKYLVKPMVDFNFGRDHSKGFNHFYPEFRLINPMCIEQKIEKDQKMYGMGIRFTKKYIKEQYGLEEDDFTLHNDNERAYPFVANRNSPFV